MKYYGKTTLAPKLLSLGKAIEAFSIETGKTRDSFYSKGARREACVSASAALAEGLQLTCDTKSWVMIPGLYAIMGAGLTGKSTLARVIHNTLGDTEFFGATGKCDVTFFAVGEPEYPSKLDLGELINTISKAKAGSVIISDSLRDALLMSGDFGATLPGGVPADYLSLIGEINLLARLKGVYLFIVLNPLLSDSQNLRSSVTSMSMGIVELSSGEGRASLRSRFADAGSFDHEEDITSENIYSIDGEVREVLFARQSSPFPLAGSGFRSTMYSIEQLTEKF